MQATTTSFEERVPDRATVEARIQAVAEAGLPWLVACHDEQVIGYAYATPHRERHAYAWSVETSVYLGPDVRGRGLGTALMQPLLEILTRQGYRSALAGVSLPNPASLALHRKLGFETAATYRQVGFKQGVWVDVWWGQRMLEACRAPELPLPLRALPTHSLPLAAPDVSRRE